MNYISRFILLPQIWSAAAIESLNHLPLLHQDIPPALLQIALISSRRWTCGEGPKSSCVLFAGDDGAMEKSRRCVFPSGSWRHALGAKGRKLGLQLMSHGNPYLEHATSWSDLTEEIGQSRSSHGFGM